MNYDDNTPIVMLTVGQLKDILNEILKCKVSDVINTEKKYVYGLRGIRVLFNVSHATAQRYKDTFLQPAVSQNGRKLVVDAELAIELFNQNTYKIS